VTNARILRIFLKILTLFENQTIIEAEVIQKMAILRNKTQNNFTIVNNKILKNKDLTCKLRGLLITMLSLPDNWNFSIKGLVSILPDGESAIRAGLCDLERFGYLKRERIRNEKGQILDVTWTITDEPSPRVENPLMDKTHVESSIQSNTNELKTNLIKNLSINLKNKNDNGWKYTYEDLELKMGIYYEKLDNIEQNVCDIFLELLNTNENFIKIGKIDVDARAVNID
jgi:hypothetical protein